MFDLLSQMSNVNAFADSTGYALPQIRPCFIGLQLGASENGLWTQIDCTLLLALMMINPNKLQHFQTTPDTGPKSLGQSGPVTLVFLGQHINVERCIIYHGFSRDFTTIVQSPTINNFRRPKIPMFSLIIKNGLPETCLVRSCSHRNKPAFSL